LRRNDIHLGPQRNLRHKTRTRRTNRGLIEIELRIGKFRTLLRHRGVHAADVCRIGEPRALLFGLGCGRCLFCCVQISCVGVEGCLCDNVLLEQFVLTIIVLLRQLELRIRPSGCRSRLVERCLKLIDFLFSVRVVDGGISQL